MLSVYLTRYPRNAPLPPPQSMASMSHADSCASLASMSLADKEKDLFSQRTVTGEHRVL